MTLTKSTIVFVLVNLVGICALVGMNSQALVIEQGDAGGPDPIGTFGFCYTHELPLMVIFFVMNFVWLLVLLRKGSCYNRPAMVAWMLSGASWLVTILCCSTAWVTLFAAASMMYEKLFGASSLH